MGDILDILEDDDLESDDALEFDDELEEAIIGGELEVVEDGVMSEARAREITEAIRAAATATFVLLAQAHEKKAYKALGYDTWAEYVKEEFDMSAQRSYQLLDLSKVMNEIESVVPEGTVVKLTEAQARDIKRELPMVTEKIREETSDLDPENASSRVDEIVNEIRDQKKHDDKEVEKKQKALDEAEEEGYRAGLEAAADAFIEKNGGMDVSTGANEVTEVGSDEGAMSPEDSMNLYNFFNVLQGLSSLPEPDDFIHSVPKNRAVEISNQLDEAVEWMKRFQMLWEHEDLDLSDEEVTDDDFEEDDLY